MSQRCQSLSDDAKQSDPRDPQHAEKLLRAQIAALQVTALEKEIALARQTREKELREKTLTMRTQILLEIRAAAKRLGTERHYHFIVPENLPPDLDQLGIIRPSPSDPAPSKLDDITDALLESLNQQYASTPRK